MGGEESKWRRAEEKEELEIEELQESLLSVSNIKESLISVGSDQDKHIDPYFLLLFFSLPLSLSLSL